MRVWQRKDSVEARQRGWTKATSVRTCTVPTRFATIAQTVERLHGKEEVMGSIPVCGSKRSMGGRLRATLQWVSLVGIYYDIWTRAKVVETGASGNGRNRPPVQPFVTGRIRLDRIQPSTDAFLTDMC